MAEFFTASQRSLQDEFQSRALADRVETAVVADELGDQHIQFITGRDMFFLSTVDEDGWPSCSYKGGAPGFVRVLNPGLLAFPNYDGNGMYLSLGNMEATAKVGLLFINFETPQRVRLRGTARILRSGPLKASYPGAHSVTEVRVDKVWLNCSRYVHRMQPQALSPFLPQADGTYRIAPWKRIDDLQDALTEHDRRLAAEAGLLTAEEYAAMEVRGEAG